MTMRLAMTGLLALTGACATAPATPVAAAPDAFASDRIAVTVKGSGPDVILIHGLSSSTKVWDDVVANLPGYRYHLVQVRGFAGTAPGANASGPVFAPLAAEIARYAATLRAPAVVGHSMGGALAVRVAATTPAVSRVMIVDMYPYLGQFFTGGSTDPIAIDKAADGAKAMIAGAPAPVRAAMQRRTIDSMVTDATARGWAYQDSMDSDPAVSGEAMRDLIRTDLRGDVARIKVPMRVLFVVPDGVPMTGAQMAGFYKAGYAGAPQATIMQFDGARHFIMQDQPVRFRADLAAFLSPKT